MHCVIFTFDAVQIHHLGFFKDEQDAARAYDRAVVDFRGASGVTNFPMLTAAGTLARKRVTGRNRTAGGTDETKEDLMARVVSAATVAQRAQEAKPKSAALRSAASPKR